MQFRQLLFIKNATAAVLNRRIHANTRQRMNHVGGIVDLSQPCEYDDCLMVSSYDQHGFKLSDGRAIFGSMCVFPRSILSWNVKNHLEICEETLSLFLTLQPKLDVLVLGIGDDAPTPELSIRIISLIKKYKMNIEVLPTRSACGHFNFLNTEHRIIGCGLIPPRRAVSLDSHNLGHSNRQSDIYDADD